MDKAKISVIMPVLNGMPYLKTALTSVLDQSLKEIEVIVVDAGSRDGSVQYVEEQKKHDSRIKLLYSECKSMGYQYNLGIQNADGEYVGFCESDDYLASDMLEKLYRTAEERGEMDFIKSDFFMFIGTAGNEFSIKYEVLSSKYRHLYGKKINIEVMPELLFRDVNMWNGIYRKDFIEKKGIRLNETQGASFQDIGFIEQVLLSGADGLYITDAYYHYRRDNEGSSVYKDTAVYVLQELSYILRFVEERKDIKEKYGDLILDRLFDFFCDRYGRKLYYDLPGTFDEFIKEIQKVLKKYIDSLPCGIKEHALNNEMLLLFMEDRDIFSVLCMKRFGYRIKKLERFQHEIKTAKELVIFGAGELGKSYLAMLVKNRYDKKIVFCDNNADLWGKNILGYEVMSVDNAAEKFPTAYFLISNREFFWAAKSQLFRCGIKGGQILEGPVLGPHSALELNWV